MMSFKTWTTGALSGLALMGFVLGSSGCFQKDDDAGLSVFHGYEKDDAKYFDPANAYDSVSLDMVPSIYETLYQYAYLNDTYKIVPLLAADMPKISADRLTLTIPIKHGVRYQDDPCFKESKGKGREVKAQDFIHAWKRLALPSLDSQGWWVFDGKLAGINAFHDKLAKAGKGEVDKIFEEDIEGVKALDDFTLQIKLLKPYPQLMYILAMSFTAPIPREAIAKWGDDKGAMNDHAVGTGPYFLKEWSRGRRIVLERNPNYHPEFYPTEGSLDFRKKGMLADAGKPLPFMDRLVFDVMREQQPRWLSFLSNTKDLLEIPKDNFAQAITNQSNLKPELAAKGVRLNIETGITQRYVSFNVKDKLFENKYLRQALSSAIDREKWIEIFTNGTGRKMVTALPPGIPDRPAHARIKYDYNLERAKELLKKAGYPNGEGLPVINFDLRGADTVSRQLGDFFTQQWGAIGVKVNVIANTFPAYLEKMKRGALQVSFGGWTMDYPDGENIYQLLYGPNKSPGPNDSNFDQPEMNKLYEEIAIMESDPKRAALIQKMDDILQEEVPWALGYYEASYVVTQPWVLNYRNNDIMANKYKYLRINPDVKKRYLEGK
jgi:oligopeptide transport system substrate-binding protein